jgi:hypothetical protein
MRTALPDPGDRVQRRLEQHEAIAFPRQVALTHFAPLPGARTPRHLECRVGSGAPVDGDPGQGWRAPHANPPRGRLAESFLASPWSPIGRHGAHRSDSVVVVEIDEVADQKLLKLLP